MYFSLLFLRLFDWITIQKEKLALRIKALMLYLDEKTRFESVICQVSVEAKERPFIDRLLLNL